MLFDKVLGENEKCVFYFYLKTEGTLLPTQYIVFKYIVVLNTFTLLCNHHHHTSL